MYPVYYAAGVSAVVWYVLEHTSFGRRVYATGANPEAARLAGVRTSRVIFGVDGDVRRPDRVRRHPHRVAAVDGRPDDLRRTTCCPRSPRAFLGSTQFKRRPVQRARDAGGRSCAGRSASRGSSSGVRRCGRPNLFNGVVLLLAVGFAQVQRSPRGGPRRSGDRSGPSAVRPRVGHPDPCPRDEARRADSPDCRAGVQNVQLVNGRLVTVSRDGETGFVAHSNGQCGRRRRQPSPGPSLLQRKYHRLEKVSDGVRGVLRTLASVGQVPRGCYQDSFATFELIRTSLSGSNRDHLSVALGC